MRRAWLTCPQFWAQTVMLVLVPQVCLGQKVLGTQQVTLRLKLVQPA